MNKQTSAYLAQRRREITQRIRQTRQQKGWTQQQVADLLGCSRKRYNLMEGGQTELRAAELDFLAQTFDVPIDFFFGQASNTKS